MILLFVYLQVEMFAKTKETFGSLDIVCNNAGIEDESNWEKLLSINLVSLSHRKLSTHENYPRYFLV